MKQLAAARRRHGSRWRLAAAMDLDIPAIHQAAVDADESGFFGRKKRRRAVLAQLTGVLAVDSETVNLKSLSAHHRDMAHTFQVVTDLRARVGSIPVAVMRPAVESVGAPRTPQRSRTNWMMLAWIVATLCAKRGSPSRRGSARVLRQHTRQTRSRSSSIVWRRHGSGSPRSAGASSQQQRAWAQDDDFITRWWATRAARRLESTASIERWVDLLRHVEPLRSVGHGAGALDRS